MENQYENKKIALRSGYYFQIFDYSDVEKDNIHLREPSIIVRLNEDTFPLYEGETWEDVKKIDNLFGDQMGYEIDAHWVGNYKKGIEE